MEAFILLALAAIIVAVFWFTADVKDAVAPVPCPGPIYPPFGGGGEVSEENPAA